jgi:hypothetical protein
MAEKGSIFEPTLPEDETDEYLIAKITFTLNAHDEPEEFKPSSIYSSNAAGERYPMLLASLFHDDETFPALSSQEIPVGETATAYEIFLVKKDDATPAMLYRSFLEDCSDGLWFKLY